MRFECHACGAKYSIADEKVMNRVAKIACQKCQAQIVVRGPRQAPAAKPVASVVAEDPEQFEPTKIATLSEIERIRLEALYQQQVKTSVQETPLAQESARLQSRGHTLWYVVIDGQKQGPHLLEELRHKLDHKLITTRSYVWKKGMSDWQRLESLAEIKESDAFKDLFNRPAQEDATLVQPMPPVPPSEDAQSDHASRAQSQSYQLQHAQLTGPLPAIPSLEKESSSAVEETSVPLFNAQIQAEQKSRSTRVVVAILILLLGGAGALFYSLGILH